MAIKIGCALSYEVHRKILSWLTIPQKTKIVFCNRIYIINIRLMSYYTTKKLLWVMVFAYGICALHGQNALVPDILPSADATALGKYDKFQVSSYTGQVDISIPLYTLQANNKTIDLRLNYDGSGILARQHPGWVGQNWSLKAGGVITRTVHGLADEYGMTNGPEYNNTSFSYISVIKNGGFITPNRTSTMDSLKSLAGVQTQTGPIALDYEADVFNFNFMGISGSFFLDWDGQWKVISNQNIKVEFDIYITTTLFHLLNLCQILIIPKDIKM
jgi:hypothetical protein